ncbi:unnamed protein product [Amoebophrya sp. A120]|nr:unnamed protein product [Amoebophrya sp. A120]|eukprot:GSA120T00000697001.1
MVFYRSCQSSCAVAHQRRLRGVGFCTLKESRFFVLTRKKTRPVPIRAFGTATTVQDAAAAVLQNAPWLQYKLQEEHRAATASSSSSSSSSSNSTPPATSPRHDTKPPPASIFNGTWPRFLSKEASTAAPDAKIAERWLVVPASFLVQGSVGSVYAWSLWNEPLTRSLGVVASCSSDWDLQSSVMTFTTMACSLGVTTFFLGPWSERAGPRYTATVSALAYTASLLTCSAAAYLHSLPVLYCGGVLGGIGWGLGYISPVSTLLRWFPDRRGLAGGLALSAFGGGAAMAAPLIRRGLDYFSQPPLKVPPNVAIRTDAVTGKQFFGESQEVVYATKHDMAQYVSAHYNLGGAMLPEESTSATTFFAQTSPQLEEAMFGTTSTASDLLVAPLTEGYYLVGTGDTGAAGAFLCLAGLYGTLMLTGASLLRTPPANWSQTVLQKYEKSTSGYAQAADGKKRLQLQEQSTQGVVTPQEALNTPQFAYLWLTICGNACGGMALLSTASTVMTESFGAVLPQVVTAGFAASYVSALSLSNSAGRLGWSIVSDHVGRRKT